MRNEFVITGCGAVSPAGLGVEALWSAIAAGRSLATPLTAPQFERLPIRQAGQLPRGIESLLPLPESRVASLMALAAEEAVGQAGWGQSILSDVATGLCAATSKGDPARLCELHGQWCGGGLDGQAAGFPLCWPDGPGTMLARHFRIAGPAACPVAACATGTHALIQAANMIRHGDARRVLVVAGDASITPLLVGAFGHMGVLTDDVCRPFDRNRGGFTISEGAAAVALEAAGDCIGRPIAHLAGFLTAADPSGLTAQDTSGCTLAKCIQTLLSRNGLSPGAVALYSAHGTATPSNDLVEANAIRRVFAGRSDDQVGPRVFAAKSVLGHLLGAAGLTEAVVAIEAVRRSIHPPLANLADPDPQCDVRVASRAEPADLPLAVCTSLGFGGQIGLLAIGRAEEERLNRR